MRPFRRDGRLKEEAETVVWYWLCGVNSILERLAGEKDAKRLADIKGPHAFLYHVCEGKLQSVAKHEEQLGTLRAQKMY